MGDWGRGWGVYADTHCPMCSARWVAVAPIGSRGITCPHCNTRDENYVWEGGQHEMPNDGAWLTGDVVMAEGVDNGD